MNRYYSESWHNASPKLRVNLAEMGYIQAKARLEEARAELQNSDEEITPADSYRPMKAAAPDIKFIDEYSKKMAVQEYLEALKDYLIAKLEFERISAELNKQELLAGPKQPSLSSDGPKRTGPKGMASQPSAPVKQTSATVPVKLRGNIKKAVLEAEKGLLEGNEARAQLLLKKATSEAAKQVDRAIEDAKKNPCEKTLRGLLGDIAALQWLGGDEEKEKEGFNAAVECGGKLKDRSEKAFRSKPTKENFKKMLEGKANYQALGGSEKDPLQGVRRLRPAGPYTVAPGDTLSGISKMFYGSEGYWDVIYFDNQGVIGNNPDLILPIVTLQIP
jgi:hypothetical protein